MKISKEQLFSEDTPSHIIDGFPYVKRNCKFCDSTLRLWKAFHIQDCVEEYKAVFICLNPECPSYNEEAQDAYVRVYYTSQEAYDLLNLVLVKDPRDIFKNLREA